MKVHAVYKSLFVLVFVVVLVSNSDTAYSADTAKSPAQTPAQAPGTATSAAPAQDVLTAAEASFKKGDYDKVTDLLWKNVDTLDRKGLILLATAHEKKKEAANTLKVANILTSRNPKDFEGFYLTGLAHLMNKKNSEALEALKTALELNPKYQPAYERLAEMYEQKKNPYELRILYQDMVEKIGPKPAFLAKLCEINALDSQEDQAVKYCKEAITKDPKKAENHVYLGLTRAHSGDTEEAKKILKEAADSHSKSEFAQYTYANLLDESKDYLESAKYYKAGVAVDPQSARSWLGYAKATFEIHKFDQSLEAYKKACKLDQKTAVAFRRAANVLRASKEGGTWEKPFATASESCSGY
jgi:tetratricopeptide (TPR) repeat protein